MHYHSEDIKHVGNFQGEPIEIRSGAQYLYLTGCRHFWNSNML